MTRAEHRPFLPDEQEYDTVAWEATLQAMAIAGSALSSVRNFDRDNTPFALQLCLVASESPEQVAPTLLTELDTAEFSKTIYDDLLQMRVMYDNTATPMAKIIEHSHAVYHEQHYSAVNYYHTFDLDRHADTLAKCALFYSRYIITAAKEGTSTVASEIGNAYTNSSFYVGIFDVKRDES